MTPLPYIPMKTSVNHELLRARAEQSILISNHSWIIPVSPPPTKINYLLLHFLQKEMLYFVTRDFGCSKRWWVKIYCTGHKNYFHDIWCCEWERQPLELKCVWTGPDCVCSLIHWSKMDSLRDSHWDENYKECWGGLERGDDWEAKAAVACPIIQHARTEGSWPIRGKGEGRCQRPCTWTHKRERQLDKTEPIQTKRNTVFFFFILDFCRIQPGKALK